MRIFIVNHYAGSSVHGMEFRAYFLAREWVRAGHDVTIVAASFSHLRSKQPSTTGLVTEETLDGIKYVWIKTPSYEGNGLSRIINMMTFVLLLFWYFLSLSRAALPAAIVSSSVYIFDYIPTRLLRWRSKGRLIFEVHDLWPLTPIELGGMKRSHPFVMALQAAEDYAYKTADAVVSILPNAIEYMVSRGLKREKYYHLPNGIVPQDWFNDRTATPLGETHASVFARLRQAGKFIVGYAGSHGISNSLDTLISAAEILKDDDTIAFVLVGQGPDKADLEKRVEKARLGNVTMLPPVPRHAVPALLEKSDVLFIGAPKESLYRFGISPNKLIDYMMAAKPVIIAIEAGNDVAKDADCGLSVAAVNPVAIVAGIRKLRDLSPEERDRLGKNGRAYALEHFDYNKIALRFTEILRGK